MLVGNASQGTVGLCTFALWECCDCAHVNGVLFVVDANTLEKLHIFRIEEKNTHFFCEFLCKYLELDLENRLLENRKKRIQTKIKTKQHGNKKPMYLVGRASWDVDSCENKTKGRFFSALPHAISISDADLNSGIFNTNKLRCNANNDCRVSKHFDWFGRIYQQISILGLTKRTMLPFFPFLTLSTSNHILINSISYECQKRTTFGLLWLCTLYTSGIEHGCQCNGKNRWISFQKANVTAHIEMHSILSKSIILGPQLTSYWANQTTKHTLSMRRNCNQ